MINIAQLNQFKIAVVGLGLTGISCARFLRAKGLNFALFDTRNNPALMEQVPSQLQPLDVVLGLTAVEQLADFNALIVSPGISLAEPVIATALAQGKVLLSDIDLLNLYCDAPIVAITGTNGKSTVTSLAAQMLVASGKNVLLGGNIGIPVLDALLQQGEEKFDACVLELSSFQLERCQTLAALSSSVLNISEDHLDRYNGLADYIATKAAIYNGAKNIVLNLDDNAIKACDLSEHNANVVSFSVNAIQADFSYQAQAIYYGNVKLVDCAALGLKGLHNISNVMAALALVKPLLDNFDAPVTAAKAFIGLAHRCQFVANIERVDYINDSKATNEGSTLAAVDGLLPTIKGQIHLILGGEDKGAEFEQLAQLQAHKRIRFYLFGRCQDKLQALLNLDASAKFSDLEQVLVACKQNARAHDLVLFSPACASFDMFKNFEHRGDVFSRLVADLEVANGL